MEENSERLHEGIQGFLESLANGPDADEVLDRAKKRLQEIEIDAYALKEPLGQGGRGVVYLAQSKDDVPICETVALKLAQDADPDHTFIWEAKLLANLRHTAFPRFRGYGVGPDGRPYYVMDYIGGQSLAQRLAPSNPPLPSEEAIRILTRLLDAVAYLHRQGVVHMDLKPDNVMLDDEKQVFVIDLGSALPSNRLVEPQLRARRKAEQYCPGKRYTHPSLDARNTGPMVNPVTGMDVYSLGAITEDLVERMPESTARKELAAVARRAQSLGPDQYADANAMLEELHRMTAQQPVEAMGPARAYRLWKFLQRNHARVLTGAAVFVAVAFGAVNWQAAQRMRAERQAAQEKTLRTAAEEDNRKLQVDIANAHRVWDLMSDKERAEMLSARQTARQQAAGWLEAMRARNNRDPSVAWFLGAAALTKANEARAFDLRAQIVAQMRGLPNDRGAARPDEPALDGLPVLSMMDRAEQSRQLGSCTQFRAWREAARREWDLIAKAIPSGPAAASAVQRLRQLEEAPCVGGR